MTTSANQAVGRLNRQWDDEAANLASSYDGFGDIARHIEEEESDTENPIIADYVAAGGDEASGGMTNISVSELDALWLSWEQML